MDVLSIVKNRLQVFVSIFMVFVLVLGLLPSVASAEPNDGSTLEGQPAETDQSNLDETAALEQASPEQSQDKGEKADSQENNQPSSSNNETSEGVISDGSTSDTTASVANPLTEEDLNLDNANIIGDIFSGDQLVVDQSLQSGQNAISSRSATPTLSYSTHVQKQGWQDPVMNGEVSGTTGQGLRLEGITISVNGDPNLGIAYRTHVQKQGWQDPVMNGEVSGTTGQALRLEAIQIILTGSSAEKYDIYYRVHAQHFGWLDWASNGLAAGTEGYGYRLEAIEIQIVPKGEDAPGYVDFPYFNGSYGIGAINYKTHVQKQGWQDWTWNGGVSGTSGQALRLEGIRINTYWMEGLGVTYRTHVQKLGWQDWVSDGELSGTQSQALRLEAIQIKLTGEQADNYDVYYRVHAQKYGWLGWAKNGESAGTSCHAFRLEAIQIVLTPKGAGEPTDSYGIPPAIEAYSTEEGQAMYNVNAYRSQNGLGFVTGDLLLHQCAQIRSQELLRLFSHTRPNGSECFTVADEVGCDLDVFSENIAAGFPDGYSAVIGWMGSPGHRANILNSNNKYMGVGASYGGSYGTYWAQMFAF